ncbi:MAG: cbb3-type cytochrome oxidase assembly protein CcoS [Zoogloeaceae bacterium]|jgi:cbb3-type cytochrome oxidase maturation protein|nr:cbb3-type cytochrome oxidase assembly protein CcoS [Zoogloeaceae bacterium]
METLYILIPFSVVLVFVIAYIFWRSLVSGQFDDLEGPGFRILMDDDRPKSAREEDGKNQSVKTAKREKPKADIS